MTDEFAEAVIEELRERGRQTVVEMVREVHIGNSRALSPTQAAHEADLPADPDDAEAVAEIADSFIDFHNDTTPMNDRPSNPREWTREDYHSAIKIHAEAAEEALDEFPEDFETEAEAVEYAIGGTDLIIDYGQMLVTVLMSDTNPDNPDYCSPWLVRAGAIDTETTWAEIVGHMAYTCVYDDVMGVLRRDE